ncbi:uncharacterized protein BDV17DRAFT_274074 [Aspergillus undulatus]|uniref:uncharacterized protein n=1 Tax=Aspergillus undulatus TaxID=1810928 RepID=UPI003CCD3D66
MLQRLRSSRRGLQAATSAAAGLTPLIPRLSSWVALGVGVTDLPWQCHRVCRRQVLLLSMFFSIWTLILMVFLLSGPEDFTEGLELI